MLHEPNAMNDSTWRWKKEREREEGERGRERKEEKERKSEGGRREEKRGRMRKRERERAGEEDRIVDISKGTDPKIGGEKEKKNHLACVISPFFSSPPPFPPFLQMNKIRNYFSGKKRYLDSWI